MSLLQSVLLGSYRLQKLNEYEEEFVRGVTTDPEILENAKQVLLDEKHSFEVYFDVLGRTGDEFLAKHKQIEYIRSKPYRPTLSLAMKKYGDLAPNIMAIDLHDRIFLAAIELYGEDMFKTRFY